MKKTIIILGTIFLFSCGDQVKKTNEATVSETVEDVNIIYDENFASVYEPTIAKSIDLSKYGNATNTYATNLKTLDYNSEIVWADLLNEKFISEFTDMECWDERPKDIHTLTDGVLIDAYSFEKGDEVKLGLLGFLNINIKDNQKIVVVEFSQEGTQYCKEKSYKYGIGARLMLKVNKSKRSAKLNTPQQITASVIFGKAEVTYSLKTFGIVGPGIAELNKTGALSEDTYQEFLQGISNLIVEMYKEKSEFIITPQPLFIWNEK